MAILFKKCKGVAIRFNKSVFKILQDNFNKLCFNKFVYGGINFIQVCEHNHDYF